ncbi:MAG: chorismate mutase [Gemmatimonadota bacterium]
MSAQPTTIVGIRGAVQATADTAAAIEGATRELLFAMVAQNRVDPAAIVALWLTQTPDLTAAHAPAAARGLGWTWVPLLGAQEAPVTGQLPRVVRALLLAPRSDSASAVRHVYLGAARVLRPDWSEEDPESA